MDSGTLSLIIIIIVLFIINILLIVYVMNTYIAACNKEYDNNNENKNKIKQDDTILSLQKSPSQIYNNASDELIEPVKSVSFKQLGTQTEMSSLENVTMTRPELQDLVVTEAPNPAVLNNFAILGYDRSKIYDPLVEPTRRVDRYELPKYFFKNMIDYPTRGYPDNYSQIGILVHENNHHNNFVNNNINYNYNNYKNNNNYRTYNKNRYGQKNRNKSKSKSKNNKKLGKHKHNKGYKSFDFSNDDNISYNDVSYNTNYNDDVNKENKIIRLFGRQQYPGSNKWEYYVTINSGLDRIKIPLNTNRNELYTADHVYLPELNTKYRVRLYDYDAPRYYPDLI